MAYVSSLEQIGMKKGLEKGRQTSEALSLQRLLSTRFGPLSPDLIATIGAAPISDIEVRFDKAIDAPSLSDVFAV